MLCVLYVTTVTALLGTIALLIERVIPEGWPRRWLWCGALAISLSIPGYYRAHHTWSVGSVSPGEMATLSGWARVESLDSYIGQFWYAASALLIAWGIINACRVALILRSARNVVNNPSSIDEVPVVVTNLTGPATVGLWHPRVLVPRWVLALPHAQRSYVLRHEDEHRRSHDARLLFVASLSLILMPWNPALWWQLRRLRLAVEMDCDRRVVRALGDEHAYGELLLQVAQASSRRPRLQPALLGVGMLERRITQLVAPTPVRHLQRILLPAFALGLLLVVLRMPHPILDHTTSAHSTESSRHATLN